MRQREGKKQISSIINTQKKQKEVTKSFHCKIMVLPYRLPQYLTSNSTVQLKQPHHITLSLDDFYLFFCGLRHVKLIPETMQLVGPAHQDHIMASEDWVVFTLRHPPTPPPPTSRASRPVLAQHCLFFTVYPPPARTAPSFPPSGDESAGVRCVYLTWRATTQSRPK